VCCRLQAADARLKLGEVADSVGKRGWVVARVPRGVCRRWCWGEKGSLNASAGIWRPEECRLQREWARALADCRHRRERATGHASASLIPIDRLDPKCFGNFEA